MIIPIDAEKAFDKIKHTLMIKNFQKSGNRGKIPQHIKKYLQKPTANIIINGKGLKTVHLR